MANAFASYTGISIAESVAASILPTSILFDTSVPTGINTELLPTATSILNLPSLLNTFDIPTALLTQLPLSTIDVATIVQTTPTGIPAAASYFRSDGGIGVTTLASTRLVTTITSNSARSSLITSAASSVATSSTKATSMSTSVTSIAARSSNGPLLAEYNPNAAAVMAPQSCLIIAGLVLAMLAL